MIVKKRMIGVMALLLAVLMLLSFTACSSASASGKLGKYTRHEMEEGAVTEDDHLLQRIGGGDPYAAVFAKGVCGAFNVNIRRFRFLCVDDVDPVPFFHGSGIALYLVRIEYEDHSAIVEGSVVRKNILNRYKQYSCSCFNCLPFHISVTLKINCGISLS